MSGLLEKARLFTLGNLHDLMDKAIDMNSPSMIRQNIRDLEDAEGKFSASVAEQNGALRTMTREKGDLDSKIAAYKVEITNLLKADPTSQLARSKGALVLQLSSQSDSRAVSISVQSTLVGQMQTALQNLHAKHDLMVARLRELERLDRETKAKNAAASAIESFASAGSSLGSDSVDNLEDRMRRKNDVASAKFDQAIGGITPEPETNTADVDALLASLKG